MKEYREFPRLHASCDLTWRVIDDAPGTPAAAPSPSLPLQTGGFLQNISGGGLCFTSPTPPALGALLALRMGLPGVPAPVIALGCAKWVEPSGERYDVGIEFWWIGWQDQGAQADLGTFITHKLATPPAVTK